MPSMGRPALDGEVCCWAGLGSAESRAANVRLIGMSGLTGNRNNGLRD